MLTLAAMACIIPRVNSVARKVKTNGLMNIGTALRGGWSPRPTTPALGIGISATARGSTSSIYSPIPARIAGPPGCGRLPAQERFSVAGWVLKNTTGTEVQVGINHNGSWVWGNGSGSWYTLGANDRWAWRQRYNCGHCGRLPGICCWKPKRRNRGKRGRELDALDHLLVCAG